MVIDEDLGLSAASTAGRAGFQRLVAEVGLGHVGLVLGFRSRAWPGAPVATGTSFSRSARSPGTLIADCDGVYDPAFYNDRLLLGLKGTMSEAELHIMRARLRGGLLIIRYLEMVLPKSALARKALGSNGRFAFLFIAGPLA